MNITIKEKFIFLISVLFLLAMAACVKDEDPLIDI